MKQQLSAFDIVGPRMIGPSSSHTAGAARLAAVARRIAGAPVRAATFTLYGSFAHTGRGHGTDRALVAGMLGMAPDDERLPQAFDLAEQAGLLYAFGTSDEECDHPNTVRIQMDCQDGSHSEILGASVGGGNIEVQEINGLDVHLTGNYPTLLIEHRDRPGAISDVTQILTDCGINIAFMRVFREQRGDRAAMVIETDQPLEAALLERIRGQVPELLRVISVV